MMDYKEFCTQLWWGNKKRVESFKDKHKGETCFIAGTGPSLDHTDLSLLEGRYLFSCNSFHAKARETAIYPQYWGISDYHNMDDVAAIENLPTGVLFIGYGAALVHMQKQRERWERLSLEADHMPVIVAVPLPYMIADENRSPKVSPKWADTKHFAYHPELQLMVGHTVVMDVCVQMAYYMGFQTVYLLGCDCDYSGQTHYTGSPKKYIDSFWEKKKKPEVFLHYELCRKAFESDGRKIYNSTVGGKLEVFERVPLECAV